MEAKYIMDMQTNFLILDGKDNTSNNYASKMIVNNNIGGLLNVELRSIDDKDYFYYNITSKESLFNIYENKLLRYTTLKNVLIKIIEILERSSDYLLDEEGFILKPEYIYINQVREEPFLCYYVDYKKPLIEQFCKLLEYFMNKVDYKDEKAVLLVYALYKITKESNITYGHLKDELYKDIGGSKADYTLASQEKDLEINYDKADYNALDFQSTYKSSQGIPMENNPQENRFRNLVDENNEKEELKFSKSSYIIAGISIVLITITFIAMFQTKVLYNSFGNQIDMIKLACFIIIMATIEGLILSKVFHKDRRIVKVVANKSYYKESYSQANLNKSSYESQQYKGKEDINIDSNYNSFTNSYNYTSLNEDTMNNNINTPQDDNYKTEILSNSIDDTDEEDNKTEILEDFGINIKTYYLESLDNNEDILINQFPFIIGKNRKGVNYRLDEPSVSRFHARFFLTNENITIIDLGSTNGTYVNGEKIVEHSHYNLSVNDVVSFSKCRFILKEN